MKYKAKKESMRAQLRSKQTDMIDQLAAAIGLNSYCVFEDIKLQARSSERSLKENTSDDDADFGGDIPSGLSKLITQQPLTATFQYLLSLISSMYKSSPKYKERSSKVATLKNERRASSKNSNKRNEQRNKQEEEVYSKYTADHNEFEHDYKSLPSAVVGDFSGHRFSFDPTPHFLKQAKEMSKLKKRSKSRKKKTKTITKEFVSSPISLDDNNAISIKSPEDQIRE